MESGGSGSGSAPAASSISGAVAQHGGGQWFSTTYGPGSYVSGQPASPVNLTGIIIVGTLAILAYLFLKD